MIESLYILPVLLFSVVIHEVAHGLVALKLGDPTAKEAGRLTMNPLPHIDLFGSIIVPLLSILVAGRVFIAWAKPVPVNGANFSHRRRDDIFVSVVGPLSNLMLAFLCSIGVILISLAGDSARVIGGPFADEAITFLMKMMYGGVYLNIVLAVFNMLPVPPLDGSHVLASLLPPQLAVQYQRIGFLGIFILIFLMRVPEFSALFIGIITTVFMPFQSLIHMFV